MRRRRCEGLVRVYAVQRPLVLPVPSIKSKNDRGGDFSARTRGDCDAPKAFQFLDSILTPDSTHFERATEGCIRLLIGGSIMETDHPSHDKQVHLALDCRTALAT